MDAVADRGGGQRRIYGGGASGPAPGQKTGLKKDGNVNLTFKKERKCPPPLLKKGEGRSKVFTPPFSPPPPPPLSEILVGAQC